jgi:hypothetical protein
MFPPPTRTVVLAPFLASAFAAAVPATSVTCTVLGCNFVDKQGAGLVSQTFGTQSLTCEWRFPLQFIDAAEYSLVSPRSCCFVLQCIPTQLHRISDYRTAHRRRSKHCACTSSGTVHYFNSLFSANCYCVMFAEANWRHSIALDEVRVIKDMYQCPIRR